MRYLFIALSLLSLPIQAQSLHPVTRFHAGECYPRYYDDYFLSGFLQSTDTLATDATQGILQMPFVGKVELSYIGEKDSTQYVAYATRYHLRERPTNNPQTYTVKLQRYGIQAFIQSYEDYSVQRYAFPDTLAAKGFLIDLDHMRRESDNENMKVTLIDRYTLRACKRKGSQDAIYYYVRFSHPYDTWSIRQDKIELKNGLKDPRCKVTLTFALEKGEPLLVRSAVSTHSTNEAYRKVEGHLPETLFSDN